mgnify:CR=1 FL=1
MYSIDLDTSSEKKIHIYDTIHIQLFDCMGYFPDRLCGNIMSWKNPSEKGKEVHLSCSSFASPPDSLVEIYPLGH